MGSDGSRVATRHGNEVEVKFCIAGRLDLDFCVSVVYLRHLFSREIAEIGNSLKGQLRVQGDNSADR